MVPPKHPLPIFTIIGRPNMPPNMHVQYEMIQCNSFREVQSVYLEPGSLQQKIPCSSLREQVQSVNYSAQIAAT